MTKCSELFKMKKKQIILKFSTWEIKKNQHHSVWSALGICQRSQCHECNRPSLLYSQSKSLSVNFYHKEIITPKENHIKISSHKSKLEWCIFTIWRSGRCSPLSHCCSPSSQRTFASTALSTNHILVDFMLLLTFRWLEISRNWRIQLSRQIITWINADTMNIRDGESLILLCVFFFRIFIFIYTLKIVEMKWREEFTETKHINIFCFVSIEVSSVQGDCWGNQVMLSSFSLLINQA